MCFFWIRIGVNYGKLHFQCKFTLNILISQIVM